MNTTLSSLRFIAIIFCFIAAVLISIAILGYADSQEVTDILLKLGLVSIVAAIASLVISSLKGSEKK